MSAWDLVKASHQMFQAFTKYHAGYNYVQSFFEVIEGNDLFNQSLNLQGEERLSQYQDQLAQNRYNYDLMIRDHEQQSLDAQFLKSNELYDAQTDLNSRTANDARDAEIIKYQILDGVSLNFFLKIQNIIFNIA